MRKSKLPVISVIIVHYNVKKELFDCISSIYKAKSRVKFEIIVVDNDEKKVIEDELRKKFPSVQYIKNVNNGWGGGTNKGLTIAQGEYVYLLNPDTIVYPNAIDGLYEFIIKHPKAGIVSSLLLDPDKNVYPLQGTKELTPLSAVMGLSAINKLFPNNPWSRSFWLKDMDRTSIHEVEVSTLSAAMLSRMLLEQVGGFDENIFLYFEEYDLSKRVRKAGYRNYIIPNSRVIHIWEASTKKSGESSRFMGESRRYYFKKYYGNVMSLFVEFLLKFNRQKIGVLFLAFILLLVLIYVFSLQ